MDLTLGDARHLSDLTKRALNRLYRPARERRGAGHVEFATLEWADWFNNRRLLEPIGNIPPAEAEARFYAMLDEQKLAA